MQSRYVFVIMLSIATYCPLADEVSWTEQQGRFSPPCITKLLEVCRTLFPVTATATSNVPTFPCGLCTFVMASTNKVKHCSFMPYSVPNCY